MKQIIAFLVVLLVSLMIVTPALAWQTGVSGRLWDSATPPHPWQYGADVYATNCNVGGGVIGTELYATLSANIALPADYGKFSGAWLVDDLGVGGLVTPGTGDYVCLIVIWKQGPGGSTPAQTTTDPIPYVVFLNGLMEFGNIQSGSNPTAITLESVSAISSRNWLPVGMLVAVIILGGAGVFFARRKH